MKNNKTYDIEYHLIGSFLRGGLTRTAREVIGWLEPEMFENYQLAGIYSAIRKQSRKDNLIDLLLLNTDYQQDFGLLAEIAKNNASASNLAGYAEKVRSYWVNRQAVKLFLDSASQLSAARTDEETALVAEKGLRAMQKLLSDKTRIEPVIMGDLLESYLDVFDKRTKKDFSQRLLDTGIEGLDEVLGGINPNDLVIIAGRPAMGKTEMGLTITRNIVEEKGSVLFFSLEMGNIQLMDRLVSAATQIGVQKLRKATGLDDTDFGRIGSYIQQAQDHELYFVDRSGLTVEQITAIAEKHLSEKPLSAIVIDYLGFINHGASDNMAYKIAETTKALKEFAKEFNVPVLLLCQLNRNLEQRADKRPTNSDLRESGAIEQDADRIIMLYREKAYKKDSHNDYSEAIVTKNRFGELGTAYMQFKNGHFVDCDQAQAYNVCNQSSAPEPRPRTYKSYAKAAVQ